MSFLLNHSFDLERTSTKLQDGGEVSQSFWIKATLIPAFLEDFIIMLNRFPIGSFLTYIEPVEVSLQITTYLLRTRIVPLGFSYCSTPRWIRYVSYHVLRDMHIGLILFVSNKSKKSIWHVFWIYPIFWNGNLKLVKNISSANSHLS